MKKIALAIIVLLSFFSCKKEDTMNLDQTIYVRNKGADMPVYMRGNVTSKVIILIVHGGPGGSGLEYRTGKWTVDLEKKYAMAYWDQRGQGMSHGHFKKNEVNVELMVDDMNAVIKVLKAKYGSNVKVFALGHSWGGTLSAKYVTTKDYQNNLAGWIEANGAHDIPKLNIESIKMYRTIGQEQINLGNNTSNWQGIVDWASKVDTNSISTAQGGEINSNGQKVEAWLESDKIIQTAESGGNKNSLLFGPTNPLTSLIAGNQTNSNLSSEVDQLSLTNQLYKVTIPTLVLWGKYDFIVPPALAQDTYDKISSTTKKLVIFEKSGHSPMSNEWAEFSKEVSLFIEQNK